MKKYLIRIVGALCILGAAALMFFPSWLTVEDVRRKDLRAVRDDIVGMTEKVSDAFVEKIEESEDFQDDLQDSDLPYTRSKVRSRFGRIADLAEELLNEEISLKELTQAAFMTPGVLRDMENLLDSPACNMLFDEAAYYTVFEGSRPYQNADHKYVDEVAGGMTGMAEDAVESLSGLSFLFIGVGAVVILILLLAVLSAVTHVCNKGRWVKYLFLLVLIAMVAGSCVGLSMASDALANLFSETPELMDASLRMTFAPFAAVVLMFIPIVLDIIYERKTKE